MNRKRSESPGAAISGTPHCLDSTVPTAIDLAGIDLVAYQLVAILQVELALP